MIGYLKGKAKNLWSNKFIINTGSIGYTIEASTLNVLDDSDVEAYIYTHVRENDIKLYAFANTDQLELFEQLISVSGIGPKAGMTILNELGVEGFVSALVEANPKALKVK